ncbi:MAG TPA: ATP-binding protein, partial [Puia sp.]|nr:ATP-binding protein [Puia sp.]
FDRLPSGAWEEQPYHAMAIPVMLQGRQTTCAVMFAGLNPFRQPDNQYGNFIRLVADQIVQGLASATVIEGERRRAEAMAELDKAKTLFFSNISHEFRTPITLMLGPLEELLNNHAIDLKLDTLQAIEMTHHNALRLLKLVNTLLDFSRIESGRHSARYAPTDIAAFTRNLAGNFRAAIERAGLRFNVRADDAGSMVYLDPGMWEKIVFNLLSNALKYTLRGSITVEVNATRERVELVVTDTGVGIPAEELPHIFERFHRVQNTEGRTFEGTGIGLSLVRELVQLHGGMITVDSLKGRGSRFTVSLPVGKDHLPANQVTETQGNIENSSLQEYIEEAESLSRAKTVGPEPSEKDIGFGSRATVLIVDDNADMRRHIQSVISGRYDILMAQNGMEALEIIAGHRPSLILSDLMMPVMDGAELLKRLKQDRDTSQIPVILITARAGEESRIEGFEMGADDYLVKPFSGRELLSRIRSQLRLTELRIHAYDQMKSVFMEAPVAIQILRGPDFVYELMNEHCARIMGLKREDVVGRTVEEVLPQAAEFGYIDLLRRVYEKGESHTANEMPYNFMREGQLIPGFVRFIYTPLRDEEGRVDRVLVTGEDISAQVMARRKIERDMIESRNFTDKLEREVDARTRDLVIANKELESFNYVTSHDLQEPLRKIQMFIDRIKNDPGSATLFMEKINESAMRMRQLIESMLAYSRLTNAVAATEMTDLNEIMAEVCRDYDLVIEEKHAAIEIGELPTIIADPFQMKQLFSNLLANSLKFCDTTPVIIVKSTIVSDISLVPAGPREAGDRLPTGRQSFAHIRFSDNGIGFEAEYSKKIFEIFQRLHGRNRYSGTGIGLSIVKKIVENHSGHIQAESGNGEGATFHIWLPVRVNSV